MTRGGVSTGSTTGAGTPRLVLVGPPGAGKTAVGRVLARRWGVPLCDTDAAVELLVGRPIADIFVDDGEAAFRALERNAVAAALSGCDGVVSLGGGAVMALEVRDLLAGHRVVFLDVGLAAASTRVGLGATRPLLLGNVRGQLKGLLDRRRPLYQQVATLTVSTANLGVEEVADEIERLSMDEVTRIQVRSESPYDVVIGSGVQRDIAAHLGAGVRRVGVIHPQALAASGQMIRDELNLAGLEVALVEVPNGEAAKSAEVAAACWQSLGQLGFTRSDAVVSVGGGATTDLAGFVAATFMRGVAIVHVPTTLLAMVDAAVGGKTGINTSEGKNLVGAFHEPAAVLCDLDHLRTLSRPELVSGLAEIIKCGFIADPKILRIVQTHPAAAADPATAANRQLIERAIQVKADVVAADLREVTSSGAAVGREALNYGHTLGHAIERVEGYSLRHGEAVSIGMVYAAELARLSGRLDAAVVEAHRNVLDSVGLPTMYPSGRWMQLHEAMRIDKKSRGDDLRFVILEAIGRPVILEAPDQDLLTAAYAKINCRR